MPFSIASGFAPDLFRRAYPHIVSSRALGFNIFCPPNLNRLLRVKQLIDPSTGLSLGNAEQQVSELHVETVNEKFLVALPVGAIQTKRGDLVRIKPHA